MPRVEIGGKVKHYPYSQKGKAMAKKARMGKDMDKMMKKKMGKSFKSLMHK